MKTTTSIRTRIAAAVLATGAAAAITGGIVGTGTASAAVPESGTYTADIYAPYVWGLPSSAGTLPASIRGGVLTIGGQSGKLTPTAHGSRATIAGVPVVLDEQRNEPGASKLDRSVIIEVVGGAAMGQLIPTD